MKAKLVTGDRGVEAPPGSSLQVYLERVAPVVVAVTYGFVPNPQQKLQPVTIRFTGHRVGAAAKPRPGDHFVYDKTVDGIIAGSGPIAITAKVPGVNPGDWEVRAQMLPAAKSERGQRRRSPSLRLTPQPVYPAAWSWRRWRLTEGSAKSVTTCPAPLARAPGVLLGGWAALSLLGIVTALVTQAWIISAAQLRLRHVLSVSVAAIVAGVIGAKVWFVVVHRRARRREGWCIQGLVAGIAIVAPLVLAATGNSVGTYFDASAPALLFGMAVGRLGCFFTGCCSGRPTASRWGVWSSDRRPVGMRRVPTQLIESALTMALAAVTAVGVLAGGPAHGAWFVAGLAAYTIVRQGVLRLRAERRQSKRGSLAVAMIAAVVLVADLATLSIRAL